MFARVAEVQSLDPPGVRVGHPSEAHHGRVHSRNLSGQEGTHIIKLRGVQFNKLVTSFK